MSQLQNNPEGREWNPAQQQAICHRDGAMLVLAGPGSGKTAVITERIRYLIQEAAVRPEEILVITFTRAAAEEMRMRFTDRIRQDKGQVPTVTFGTFHSFFFRILKYAYHYSADSIIREDEQRQILREALEKEDLDIGDESEFIQNVLSEIGILKNDRISPEQWRPSVCERTVFLRLYRHYDRRLVQLGKIDFDDMLVYTYELLSERKDILRAWQERYHYFLVDEFQDVNRIQYDVLRLLVGEQGNLFVVGDDDQSIYRFRGARPEIMLNFRKDYPDAAQVLLNVNYRSQAGIVEKSLCLINHNQNRYVKKLKADRPEGAPVEIHDFRNLSEESSFIVEDIRRRIQHGVNPGNLAVLYRTGNQARPVLDRMMEYNVPFSVREGMPDLYRHWIALDCMSYIRIGQGSQERRDFLRIMNRPNRYISRDAVSSPRVSFARLKAYYHNRDWMEERIEQFSYDVGMLKDMNPYAALHYIRHVIGYEGYLREYASTRRIPYEELMDILEELMESAKGYADTESWFSHIRQYQESWERELRRKTIDRNAVAFMTMHAAKGLEYSVVYILDANEEITPHKKAVTPEEIEEERRLFYVAMTRSRDELHICTPKECYSRKLEPSRFLGELSFNPEKLREKGTVWHRVYGKGRIVALRGEKADIFFEKIDRKITLNIIYCVEHGILRTE